MAATFLTIVPLPSLRRTPPALGTAAPWFPLVGAAIGATVGSVAYLTVPSLGTSVAAVLATVALTVITGGLHLDGLADCADALGARGGSSQRRLAVMRDSAIGSFGALALIFWLALIIGALAALDRQTAFSALLVAVTVGRLAALLHTIVVAPARPEGLGASFTVSISALCAATVIAALICLALVGIGRSLAALSVAIIVAALTALWARAALGGRTGDTLGATVALTEVTAVVATLALS